MGEEGGEILGGEEIEVRQKGVMEVGAERAPVGSGRREGGSEANER